ncbi:MAG TPA: hypothetical protein VG735_03255 [Caulobacterales bacterium]|nr:hypothetical protein [Caulobacterales bacterium]
MIEEDSKLSPEEVAAAKARRLEAMKLREIEGSPLSAEEVSLLERFEREAWSPERRLAFLLERAKADA